jgi:MATE family multidrug resistance protein
MRKILSYKNDIYPLVKLTIPLALTGITQSAVWFFETIFLAHLSSETLAAGSLVSWFFGTLAVILFGILSSINILVAYKHGANDQNGIALVARDGLILAILVTIPATILFWYMSPVFLLFGQSAAIVALAESYLRPLAWGLLADFIMIACLEVIMGVGHARVILIFTVLSVSLNILFSYVLIFGKFGFKALGIAGAGWGMTASYWLSCIALIAYIISDKTYRYYFRTIFHIQKPIFLKELFHIGFPIGIMYCVEVAFFFALTLCMGLLGSEMQAANQVALQYMGLLMTMMFSIAQAITIRIGHLIGAKQRHAVEKAAYLGVLIAAVTSALIGIVYLFSPSLLISIDFDVYDPKNTEVVKNIKILLAICAIFQIFEATRIAFFGALRGIKDTKFTLLASVLSFWGIALPLGYFLAIYLKLDGAGFWWGMVAGALMGAIVMGWRFRWKMKRNLNLKWNKVSPVE